MADLTKQQQKNWDTAVKNVNNAWQKWHTAYNVAKDGHGNAVVLEGSELKTLWDELEAARAKRNSLLARYRSLGVQI